MTDRINETAPAPPADAGELNLDSPEAFDAAVDLSAYTKAAPVARAETPTEAPEAVSAEIEALKQERDRLWDQLLRKAAEFENYRKRVERQRREQTEREVISLLLDITSIVDDLERALETGTADVPPAFRQGIELIHRSILELLRKRDVRPIDAVGSDFDPNVHQAVVEEASETHRDGEVMEEFRRGYMIGDRLLRAAMVKVAKRS